METKSHGGRSALHGPPEIFTDDGEASGIDAFPTHERIQWGADHNPTAAYAPTVASAVAMKPWPAVPLVAKPAAPAIAPSVAPLFANVDTGEDDVVFPGAAASRRVADPWSGAEDEPMTTPPEDSDSRPVRDVDTVDDEPVLTTPRTQDELDDAEPIEPDRGGGWTLPMLCAGIAMIAACVLMPLAEENHQLVYQRDRLKLDLAQVNKQVAVNDNFLGRIKVDPTLAERLAQRQMKTIRKGEAVLDIGSHDKQEMSPFMLVTVPPPAPMAEYRPVGGAIAAVTRNARTRLFILGGGLFLIMLGLVLGYAKDRRVA